MHHTKSLHAFMAIVNAQKLINYMNFLTHFPLYFGIDEVFCKILNKNWKRGSNIYVPKHRISLTKLR